MHDEEFWGYQIFLRTGRWEVFDSEGTLLAEGRGGITAAQHWIWTHIIDLTEQLAAADRKH